MNRRLVVIGAVGLAAIVAIAVLLSTGGSDESSAAGATQEQLVTTTASATTTPPASTTSSVPATIVATTTLTSDCTTTQEPHITARGVITAIKRQPVAPQGEYAGELFSLGNAVSVTVPEAGGPVYASVVAVFSTDAGAGSTYQVGHDSRAAYPPPDPRSPENYLAWSAVDSEVTGTVGLALATLEAGQVPSVEPPPFEQATFTADFDAAGGVLTGTVTHPETTIEFVAGDVTVGDQPVFPTPECYQQAVEEAREADNPSSP